jgi:uncharacterized protein (DUF885 family)
MTEAATTRDEAIADSKAKLMEALKAADQALAEANTATMKEFNDAMAENAAALAEALAQIQKDYEDTIAKIAEELSKHFLFGIVSQKGYKLTLKYFQTKLK